MLLSKSIIKKEICSCLDFGKINKNTKVKDYQVVMAILYRLKTGCQWRQLPMKQFFRDKYSWHSVYYHFQKWSKDGSWESVWHNILKRHKHLLESSSIRLDDTYSRKTGRGISSLSRAQKSKTTNNLGSR